jgi:hypothetical protein
MLRMKDTNKLIRNFLRSLPALPLLAQPRRRRSDVVLPYILGAVGVAIAGGIAAVMLLSPRTRQRTLGIAKESYGKVRGQLGHIGTSERHATMPKTYSNSPGGTGANEAGSTGM